MREKNRNRLNLVLVSSFAGLLCWPAASSAQSQPRNTEWPSYGADLAGTRYRPLDQINAANFSDLEIAWRIKTDNFGDRPEYKLEGTPLMVNGTLYATAGSRRAVIALDPATRSLHWTPLPANCSGFTASMKANAAAPLPASFPGAAWRIGPTVKKNESST